jgi:hypothetical protein
MRLVAVYAMIFSPTSFCGMLKGAGSSLPERDTAQPDVVCLSNDIQKNVTFHS